MRGRILIDRDVRVVGESLDGLVLSGRIRLRPGHPVDLFHASRTGPVIYRRVFVSSWAVVSLGSDGPMYRGDCRWE